MTTTDIGTASSGPRRPAPHGPIAPSLRLPLAELLALLQVDGSGLTDAEAQRRLATTGPNALRDRPYANLFRSLVAPLLNPLVIVLLVSAGVSGVLGDGAGAALICAIVLLSTLLNGLLSFRSQRAAARLRAEILPTATVRRDGVWCERPRPTIVPGDLIRLSAGDHVPADVRLLDARDLHIQQAALTGESMPVEKEPVDRPDPAVSAVEARCNVFLGTSVVAGTATAVVVATGRATAFGEIAESLSARPPQTEFERGLGQFARLIVRTVVLLVLFVLLSSIVLGRPLFESLLFSVALAVGLTPEFMPMITTVTLARGAVRMARRNVIVKHLAAIDDFGSMDTLLSDKTGTLTTGVMTLSANTDARGGATRSVLDFAYLNSACQTGIRSPLDGAVLEAHGDAGARPRKLDEIPFDFERRRLSVVVEDADGALLITKGAPESVMPLCTQLLVDGKTLPADAASLAECAAIAARMGDGGQRVIAVAHRRMDTRPRYAIADECDLVLTGFLAFTDPLGAGVRESLQALATDGIKVKILTGDDERVARHVCGQVGIDAQHVVLGRELDGMDDAGLAELVERHDVFARVLPAHKLRIVLALKQKGHVVGFLGDGINDAPSLHAADVGISVANAVDVAKDAADIILRERSLGVLHNGVIEGRRAFANVMKYLLMGTSSNFGNMFSMAAGVLFLPFLPMLPTQILLNNFLYDLAQVTIPGDNVDPSQLVRPQRWNIGFVRRFMLWMGPISSIYDLLTFAVLIVWFHASAQLFHTGWFVESLATQTLVVFVIRTFGNPLRSRPSLSLAFSVLAVVAIAVFMPWTPWAQALGFVRLPFTFFAFLTVATLSYLAIVEWAKRRLFGEIAAR